MGPQSQHSTAICSALLVASLASPSFGQGNIVEVWVRASASQSSARSHSISVDVAAAPLVEVDQFDAQYGAHHRYRGVPLEWLINAATVPPTVDLALLHFENGMVVPLRFREASEMERLAPFVAVEVWTVDTLGRSGWSRELPDIAKKGEESDDWRPIRFHGNKMVVEALWHPDVPAATLRVFSPWAHVDALVGVELAETRAYHRQIQGPDTAADGYRVYAERCQFCHGVRQVGASFGWDFALPVPLHTYRDPHSLLFHTKYRQMDATSRGLMMPAFPDLRPAQVAALWAWMAAIVTTGPAPYAP